MHDANWLRFMIGNELSAHLWGNTRAFAIDKLGNEWICWKIFGRCDGTGIVTRLTDVEHRIARVATVKDAP